MLWLEVLRLCNLMIYFNFCLLLCSSNDNVEVASLHTLIDYDESSEEEQKLAYICSYAIDSLKAGGSVLIPICRIGIVLQLLEQLSFSEGFLNLKVGEPSFVLECV